MKRIKKMLSAALATILIATPIMPSFAAQSEKSDYVKDVTKITKNPVVESTSIVSLDLKTANIDGISGALDLTLNSQIEPKTGNTYMEAYVRRAKYGNKSMQMPPIKLYANQNSIYLGKDSFNYALERLGINKNQIDLKKPYVKINPELLDKNDKLKPLTKMPKVNYYAMENAMRNMVKTMYLQDYLKAKKDGTVYTVDLKASEIVDLADAYMKWALRNPDVIKRYYDEIGLGEIVNAMPYQTQQQKQNQLSKYLEFSKERLPEMKEALKGSSLYYRADLQDKKAEEKINLVLRMDFGKDKGVDPTKMYDLTLKAETKSKGVEKAKIQEPKDSHILTTKDIQTIETAPTKVTINPKTGIATIASLKQPTTQKLDHKFANGTLTVKKSQLEQIFSIKIHNRYDYVPVRDVTNSGYTVDWDQKTKSIIIYPTVK